MLDPLIELIQNASPEIKLAISALIGLIGVVCVFKPAAMCISSFSKSEWIKGLVWLVAAVAVVAMSVGIIAIVYGFGQQQGNSLEDNLRVDAQNTHSVQKVRDI